MSVLLGVVEAISVLIIDAALWVLIDQVQGLVQLLQWESWLGQGEPLALELLPPRSGGPCCSLVLLQSHGLLVEGLLKELQQGHRGSVRGV